MIITYISDEGWNTKLKEVWESSGNKEGLPEAVKWRARMNKQANFAALPVTSDELSLYRAEVKYTQGQLEAQQQLVTIKFPARQLRTAESWLDQIMVQILEDSPVPLVKVEPGQGQRVEGS